MSAVFRRTFFAVVLALILLITGAWQSPPAVLAKSQTASLPETPLYPGFTWSGPASSTQDVRINASGGSISVAGQRYTAREQFTSELPQEVLNYYSNEQLAKSGWTSYDVVEGPEGIHYVFTHESGVYLAVEYLKCSQDPSSTCVAVWQSDPTQAAKATPDQLSGPQAPAATATFGKTSPTNGSTGLNPTSTTLSWEAFPNADKYKYCVKAGSECSETDPNWTSIYSRSVTLTTLAFNKTYYWQVKATTCETCVPKNWVYANSGSAWHFSTKTGGQATILGNAGVGSAILTYTDGSVKTVKADSTGAYSLQVPLHWSGTLTPSKAGYTFSPASASFTDLTAAQTIQNFLATAVYTISGNTGLAGVTLSYTNGTPQTVVSDASGNYSIGVPGGWSGTVTPSKVGYVFSPAIRTYANLAGNQTAQNFTPSVATFSISGNAGVAGVTLRYVNGTSLSVLSDASGNYSITVPYGWSGTVTPSKTAYLFSPVNRTYVSVTANQAAQNYTAIPVYSVSGNAGVAGATLSYTDGTPKTVISQSDGTYSFSVPSGWSGTVTPTHACFNFTPSNRTYSNLASNQASQNYTPALKAGCADVSVQVGGTDQGRFGVASQDSTRASFSGLNAGPVKIASTNASSLIAGERVIYRVNNINTSFSEMMALPNGQLDHTYWLPWYNNVDLDTQLRIANVSNSTATVHVLIGGAEPTGSPVMIGVGGSVRLSFAGVNAGPVQVQSNVNVVAAERVIYKSNNNVNTSFSELMALPNSQLDNTYWLPWYNNVDLDTQLRIANVTGSSATVHVLIGGAEVTGSPFTLGVNGSVRLSFAGLNAGPVQILSNQNIVAAERVIYRVNGAQTSYSETMALPNGQLDNTYWLPWYNNVDLDTQLRFANVTGSSATVHVFVGGTEVSGSPFTLGAGASNRLSFAGVNAGPVRVVSNQNIVVAERVIYKVLGVNTSYSELMALPNSQLDTSYWLPWYNNVDLDTQLRFGAP